MRGHLEQRGEDSWRLKVYVGMDGRRRRYLTKTIRGTKRAAEKQLNLMLVEAASRQHPTADPTFADLAAQWREIGSTSLSCTTRAEYERLLEKRLVPRFGSMKLRAIRPVDIDVYYAELHRGTNGAKPLGAQSIQHVHALLRMLLNQAVRWEWIPSNPVSKASPPRVPKWESVIPEPFEVQRILEDCEWTDPDLGCFIRLATISGARRGADPVLERWSARDSGVPVGYWETNI